jgi:glycosyltransferase involved in cell wall biosynthesis
MDGECPLRCSRQCFHHDEQRGSRERLPALIAIMPDVSIVVAAFNAGRTVTTALRSAFAQTYRDFEVIVADEGSTDDTVARAREWGGQVTVLSRRSGGTGSARGEAIRHSRGRLIAFLGAGDVWLPEKLERQIEYFRTFPHTGLLHSAAIVSPWPLPAAREPLDPATVERASEPPANIFCDLFHAAIHIDTSTVMTRRDVLDEAGGLDAPWEARAADWDVWLRIAARHAVGYLPMPLAVRRPRMPVSADVERTYRGEQAIIERAAPLCRMACPQAAAAPDPCIRRREHLLFNELGHACLRSGRLVEARAAYRRAIRAQPRSPRARLSLAASFAARPLVEPLRRVRRAFRIATEPEIRKRTLIHNTAYRRTRAAAMHVIHRLDDAVSALARANRRVLFEAASPLSVAVFRSVLELLQRDPRIELWFTTSDGAWDPSTVFGGAGITGNVVPVQQVRRMKFDGYINTDFWNMTWMPRCSRRVHLFHGVAGKYGLDAPTRIAPVVATFDRLLFPNRDRLSRYAEAGLIDQDGATAALVGYPKVDRLVDGSLERGAIQHALGLDPAAPTVLYAPTWSPYSSLNIAGEEIIRSLARLGGNVIVKLHDRSYDRSARGSGGVDWRTRIEGLCREWGVHLAQDFDASPYLFIADALVTDHSSVGFEFMLLDRPVVVIDCPELLVKARVNPDKVTLLRGAADVVAAADIAGAVRRAIADPLRLSQQRRRVAGELFYDPGGASARAALCIYDVLGLPEPLSIRPGHTVEAPAAFSELETRTI